MHPGRIGFTGMRMTSVIIVFVISLIVYSLLVWLGVKIAGVSKRKRTWENAILAVILMLILIYIMGFVGGTFGVLLGILGSIAIIKYIYLTSWEKAVIAWVFVIIGELIVQIVLGHWIVGLRLDHRRINCTDCSGALDCWIKAHLMKLTPSFPPLL